MDVDKKEFELAQEFARFSGAVGEKLDRAVKDITDLAVSTNSKINSKADKADFDNFKNDQEGRMRKLERFSYIALGVLFVVQYILNK